MERTRVEFRSDADDGAHRLLLLGSRGAVGWQAALVALRERIQAHRYWSVWQPSSVLDVVGADAAVESATVYLAGSLREWKALEACNVGIPAIEAAARVLRRGGGSIEAAICESRPLELAGYERITGAAPWPWRVDGPTDEITMVRPRGAIRPGQLEVLATSLEAAIHATGDRYGDQGLTVVDGDCVRLVASVPRDAALQMIHAWAQLCWVDLSLVELS